MSAPVSRDQAAVRFSQICRNCAVPTELIEDHAAGDLICKECGLVLESHAIEETSEWRSFSDSDKGNQTDMNRVGGPANRLLTGGGLGTGVAQGRDAASVMLGRLHARAADPDRALLAAFSAIGQLCAAMDLSSFIKDAACEVYKKVKDNRVARNRAAAVVHAACVFIGLRQEGFDRSFREVCGAAAGTTVKEIGAVMKLICQALPEMGQDLARKPFNDEKMVARLVSSLALPPDFARAARTIAKAFRELSEGSVVVGLEFTRRQPASIAAGALLLALRLHGGAAAGLPELSRASGMAEETISSAAHLISPHVRALVQQAPADFRRAEAVARIEAAHPIDAGTNSLEDRAERFCRDLGPEGGAARATALALLDFLKTADSPARRAVILCGATVTPLAAAVVWLALHLRGEKAPPSAGLAELTNLGVGIKGDLRVAAAAIFPHARALSAALPRALAASEPALLRIEANHARMLWIGSAGQLAPLVAAAAAMAAGSEAHLPPPAAVSATAAAIAAQLSLKLPPGCPMESLAPATAAAAVALLARLAGKADPALALAAAAACCDLAPVTAVAIAAYPRARVLAATLPPGAVAAGALELVEAEFPPEAAPLMPTLVAAPAGRGGGAPSLFVPDLEIF